VLYFSKPCLEAILLSARWNENSLPRLAILVFFQLQFAVLGGPDKAVEIAIPSDPQTPSFTTP
jgi:hypothetical protein